MLNLEAKTKEQEILKEYLEQNASETLIDKINNGVKIEKDGKILINKKTLETFMKYASDEARKQAEKGSHYAMVEDKTVFGWLMHYFEEDSIEGILYNEDGTEYKNIPSAKPTVTTTKTVIKPIAKPKEAQETISMFDMFDDIVVKDSNDEEKETYEEEVKEEIPLEIEPLDEPKPIVNVETGELLDTPDFDNEIIMKLYGIFGNELEGY